MRAVLVCLSVFFMVAFVAAAMALYRVADYNPPLPEQFWAVVFYYTIPVIAIADLAVLIRRKIYNPNY